MRKKIQDLVKGKFEYDKPEVILPYAEFKFKVLENDIFRGELWLKSANSCPIRGSVLSDNNSIRIQNQQFEGMQVQIPFEYQNPSMREGMTDQGRFIFTTNGGEYVIPFTVSASRYYYASSIGSIRTLNDFVNLAKLNWKEALQIFSSRHFLNIFHSGEEKWRLLYEGLCRGGISSHEMEEFLIGTGKKQRGTFRLLEQERTFEYVRQPVSDMLNVKKSQWGFFEVQISSDGDFIRLTNHRLSMEDFNGKHAYISYKILPEYLHAGKNTGVITVSSPFESYQCTITVYTAGANKVFDPAAIHKEQYEKSLLMEEYMNFSLGKIRKEAWIRKSMEYLDEFQERYPDQNWYRLYRVQLLFASGDTMEANTLLEEVKSQCKDKRSGMWGYILYLTTLLHPDPDDIKEQTMKIREMFFRDQDDQMLFWILLYLDESFARNKTRKYNTLRNYIERGHYSPAFYIEAYRLLEHFPEILETPGNFEYRLFYWAAKRRILSVPLAQLIVKEAEKKSVFDPKFYYLLVRCSKILKTDAAVRSMCIYLIKNQKIGPAYFGWFQKGVAAKLRIAGLHEAYLMSWRKSDGELPMPVLKYFELKTTLPSSQKAVLYSYIVRNRERLAENWEDYMKSVLTFAEEELKKGHMSEDLAALYKVYRQQMGAEQFDAVKGEIESFYQITCPVESFTNAAVLQQGNRLGQLVNMNNRRAYVRLFLDPYVILFEDINGRRYASDGICQVKQMIPGKELVHLYETLEAAEQADTQEVPKLSLTEQLSAQRCPIQEMEDLIETARSHGISTVSFEEQLLSRMLYTEQFSRNHLQMFARLCKYGENEQVREAFVSWYAWMYLCMGGNLPEVVSRAILSGIEKGSEQNAFCEIALMKYISEKRYMSEADERLAGKLLEKYLSEGLYMDFYHAFPVRLQRKYQIYDIDTVQYIGKPNQSVLFRYEVEDTLHTYRAKQAMKEVLPGIYVFHTKIFADEVLRGDIVIYENGVGDVCETVKITYKDREKDVSRYGRLNQAILDINNSKGTMHLSSLEEYAKLDDLTKELFRKL